MKYIYTVTYFSKPSDSVFGFGRLEFTMTEPITRSDQITQLENLISETYKTIPVITSFQLLRTENDTL